MRRKSKTQDGENLTVDLKDNQFCISVDESQRMEVIRLLSDNNISHEDIVRVSEGNCALCISRDRFPRQQEIQAVLDSVDDYPLRPPRHDVFVYERANNEVYIDCHSRDYWSVWEFLVKHSYDFGFEEPSDRKGYFLFVVHRPDWSVVDY